MVTKAMKNIITKKQKNVFVGTGISKLDDPAEAAKQAVEMAIKNAGKPPQFGIVYVACTKYATNKNDLKKLVDAAQTAFKANNPNCIWIGSTTHTPVSNYGFTPDTVVAMSINSPYMHFGVGVGTSIQKKTAARKAGIAAAEEALSQLQLDKYLDPYIQFTAVKNKKVEELIKMKPYSIMAYITGSAKDYYPLENDVLGGVQSVVGNIPIVGGSSSNELNFNKNYLMYNGEIIPDGVLIVATVSQIKTQNKIRNGYYPSDKVVVATKAEGKTVYEFNNRPAADVYAEMLGVDLATLTKDLWVLESKNPLAVIDVSGEYWIKAPLVVNKDKSLTFFSPVTFGTAFCLMKTDPKFYVETVKKAINSGLEQGNIKDVAYVLFFSCNGRIIYMGKNIGEEYKVLKKTLKSVPFIGMHAYGEIANSPNGTPGEYSWTFNCQIVSNELFSE